MDRSRRRVAIGVYATADNAATTMGRLQALGIAHYQCLPLPPDQAASALIASRPAKPADTSSSGPVMVRIYLRSRIRCRTISPGSHTSSTRRCEISTPGVWMS